MQGLILNTKGLLNEAGSSNICWREVFHPFKLATYVGFQRHVLDVKREKVTKWCKLPSQEKFEWFFLWFWQNNLPDAMIGDQELTLKEQILRKGSIMKPAAISWWREVFIISKYFAKTDTGYQKREGHNVMANYLTQDDKEC